jgi:hypothetical protein
MLLFFNSDSGGGKMLTEAGRSLSGLSDIVSRSLIPRGDFLFSLLELVLTKLLPLCVPGMGEPGVEEVPEEGEVGEVGVAGDASPCSSKERNSFGKLNQVSEIKDKSMSRRG